jgi:hypothetical protein
MLLKSLIFNTVQLQSDLTPVDKKNTDLKTLPNNTMIATLICKTRGMADQKLVSLCFNYVALP